eukprot:TRINITY_DN14408_c0_g1_i1.p1 TRINITY_DN14408_c0_g1~~TRINITY_DN14408_c0_g1_i1.p1  ORF type:complete len:202 (+),score=34.11 TRINITY_DN14408_c0_g1_i1:155-760(+)
MDWSLEWWIWLCIGLGAGFIIALMTYAFVRCCRARQPSTGKERTHSNTFPVSQGERRNPLFGRRLSSSSIKSSDSAQLETTEVPRLSRVIEDNSTRTVMTEDGDTITLRDGASDKLADTVIQVGNLDDIGSLPAAPQDNAASEQKNEEPEQSDEEKKAARAAKLKALRAQRANKKTNEWALLEESLSVIDQMYNEVFQTSV